MTISGVEIGWAAERDYNSRVSKALVWWMKFGLRPGYVAAVPIYAGGWDGGAVIAIDSMPW